MVKLKVWLVREQDKEQTFQTLRSSLQLVVDFELIIVLYYAMSAGKKEKFAA